MKKRYLFFFLLLSFTKVMSQSASIRCYVKDLFLSQPIPGALIITNLKDSVFTTENGSFQLSLRAGRTESIEISAYGYSSKTVFVTNEKKIVNVFLEPINYQTNSIQVRGLYTGKNLLRTPGSIATLVSKDFQRSSQTFLQNSFNLLPGVRMESQNVNTGARIVLRGYGNQNTANGIGYKAYYNDIPLTDADGTTNLDDIDFATIGRIEVFRGPVSSVYGTGIGGVVNIVSEKAPEGTTLGQSILTGSNGLFRNTTSVGIGNDRTNLIFNYGRQRTNGYRLHNGSQKNYWDLNGTIYNIQKATVSFFTQYTNSYDQLAGQVDSFGLVNYPDSAELSYIINDSHSDLESIRLGLSVDYVFNRWLSNKSTFFISTQEIGQSMSTILTKSNRSSFGMRTAFIYTPQLGTVGARFTVGLEGTKNIIYQKSYNLKNAALGTLRTDLELKPSQWNLFGGVELTIAKNTLMIFNASANFITYDNEDLRITGSGYVNQSGYRSFQPIITPRWVINHLINKNVSVYSNYSMGYAQPGTNQIIIEKTGKLNDKVKPEISNTFEVGAKASLFKQSLFFDFAFFNMEVSDKLVTQTFPAVTGQPSYTGFVNVGSVNFTGMEITLNYAFIPKNKNVLQLFRPFMTYTYNRSRNSNLKSDNNNNSATKDYTNLSVSGIPRNVLNTGFDIEAFRGWYVNVTDMYTGEMPITLDNKVNYGSYNLVNIRTGYRHVFGKNTSQSLTLDIYAGNNNIYNTTYAQFVAINLTPVNGVPPKFFTPGPRSALYAGINLRYKFK